MLDKPITKNDIDYINLLSKHDEILFDKEIYQYISDVTESFVFEAQTNKIEMSFSSELLEKLLCYRRIYDNDDLHDKMFNFNEKVEQISQLENIHEIIIEIISNRKGTNITSNILSFFSLIPLEKRIHILNSLALSDFNAFVQNVEHLLFNEEEVNLFYSSIEDIPRFNDDFNKQISFIFDKNVFFSIVGFNSQLIFVHLINKLDAETLKLTIDGYSFFLKDAIYYYNSKVYLSIVRLFDKEHLKNEIINNNYQMNFKDDFLCKNIKYNQIISETTGLNIKIDNNKDNLSLFDFNMSDQVFISKLSSFNKKQVEMVLSFIHDNPHLYFVENKCCLSNDAYEIIELNFSY